MPKFVSHADRRRDYTLERHLRSFAHDKNYEPLWSSWRTEKKEYALLLATIPETHKAFSSHDAAHSEQILLAMERLLGEQRIHGLSPTDTWLLLQCAYTHDLGMTATEKEKAELYVRLETGDLREIILSGMMRENLRKIRASLKTYSLSRQARGALYFWEKRAEESEDDVSFASSVDSAQFSQALYLYNQLVQEFYRSQHAKRSAEMVSEEAERRAGCIFPMRLRSIVAKIIRCHGLDFDSVLDLVQEENGIHSDTAHPRFVAAMLRIGDLLDLDSNRYNLFHMDSQAEIPSVSAQHYFKHRSVRRFLVTQESIAVEMHFCLKDIEAYLETHKINQTAFELMVYSVQVSRSWLSWIEEECRNIRLHWEELCPGSLGGSFASTGNLLRILVDEQPTKPSEFDLKYEISSSRASHIIEGSGLYKDKLAFLREVIQNALDATKRQLFVQMKPNWERRLLDEEKPIRKWEDLHKENKYPDFLDMPAVLSAEAHRLESAAVEVLFSVNDDGELVVTVTDRGIGITRERLKKMQQVGDIPPMEKYRHMLSWMKPTGDFGIGMQSIFLVADRFHITTRPWEKEDNKDMLRHIQFNSTRLGGDIFNYEEDVDILKASAPEKVFPHGTKVEICINLRQASKFLVGFLPKNRVGSRTGKDFRLNFTAVFQQAVERYINDAFIGEIIPIRLRFDKKYTQTEEHIIDKYSPLHTPGYVCEEPLWGKANACNRLFFTKKVSQSEEESLFFWYFGKRPARNELAAARNIFISLQLRRALEDESSKTRLFYRGILFSDSENRWAADDEQPMEKIIRIPGFQCDINLMYGVAGEIIEINREYIKRDRYATLWQELRDSIQAFAKGIEAEIAWHAQNKGQEKRRQLLDDIRIAWEKDTQGIVVDRKDKVVWFNADNTFSNDYQGSLYLAHSGCGDIYRQRLVLNDPDKSDDPAKDPRAHFPRMLYAKESTNSEIKQRGYSEVLAFDVKQEGAPAFQIFRLAKQTDDCQRIACDRNLPLIDDYSYRLIVRDIIRQRKVDASENYYPVFPARKADMHNGFESLMVCSVPIGTSAFEVSYYSHWIISPYPLCKLKPDMPFFPSDDTWSDATEYPILREYIMDAAAPDKKPTAEEITETYKKWLRVLQ